jgi:uncharacterized protein YbjT (DUF2867 family)
MKIAVAGATGRVGRHVADLLTIHGHQVVPIARSAGVDVITGTGLDAALDGVQAVVDAATGPSAEQQEATEFFTTSARNLQRAAVHAGVGQIVAVSIVGVDRLLGGYSAAKIAHEKALSAGEVPVRILRATQFHEFVEQLVQWGTRGGVAYVTPMRTQLIAARSVAERLVELATGPAPEGAAPTEDIAGPREENLVEAATALVAHRGLGLRVEAYIDPADPDAELMAGGALLPGPGATLAGPTFAEWLATGGARL